MTTGTEASEGFFNTGDGCGNQPAFPVRIPGENSRGIYSCMSLRDVFAAHALTGLLARDEYSNKDLVAVHTYRYADAMLAARKS